MLLRSAAQAGVTKKGLRGSLILLKNGCFLLHQGRNILGELTTWLSSQHPGLQTYKAFRNKTLQLSTSDAAHRALYALLGAMAGRYIESFDEEPLPVETADRAYQKLLGIVSEAEGSTSASASRQIQVLNHVASVELF
jgi:hypothetical protein